jgi:hypothetical protein
LGQMYTNEFHITHNVYYTFLIIEACPQQLLAL